MWQIKVRCLNGASCTFLQIWIKRKITIECRIVLLLIFFREDSKVSHYIINKTQQKDQARYKIGDHFFKNLPELLSFYKVHYLDTTPLIRPASKKVEKVIAKFDFDSKVSTLTILSFCF